MIFYNLRSSSLKLFSLKIEQQNKDSDPDTTNDDDDDDNDEDDDDSELTSLAKYQSKSVKPKTRKKSSSKQIITSQ